MEKGLLICSIDIEDYVNIIDGFVIKIENYASVIETIKKELTFEKIIEQVKPIILQKLNIKLENLIEIKVYDSEDEDFINFNNDNPGDLIIKHYSENKKNNIEIDSFNIAIIDII